jgi:hypothetical protein
MRPTMTKYGGVAVTLGAQDDHRHYSFMIIRGAILGAVNSKSTLILPSEIRIKQFRPDAH